MKFILVALVAISTASAVTIKDASVPKKKGDNWTEDWGYKFVN